MDHLTFWPEGHRVTVHWTGKGWYGVWPYADRTVLWPYDRRHATVEALYLAAPAEVEAMPYALAKVLPLEHVLRRPLLWQWRHETFRLWWADFEAGGLLPRPVCHYPLPDSLALVA